MLYISVNRIHTFHSARRPLYSPQTVVEKYSPVSPPHERLNRSSAGCRLLDRFHGQVLLRKEVIQPHLPVRLPCYDFVPIASPTFDHSLPYGLGHGLRVLPTFVT